MAHQFPQKFTKPTSGATVSRTAQQSNQSSNVTVNSSAAPQNDTMMANRQGAGGSAGSQQPIILSSKLQTSQQATSIQKVLPSSHQLIQLSQQLIDQSPSANATGPAGGKQVISSPKTLASPSDAVAKQQRQSPTTEAQNSSALAQYRSRPSSNNKRRSLKPVVVTNASPLNSQLQQSIVSKQSPQMLNSSGYLIKQLQNTQTGSDCSILQRNVPNKMISNSATSNSNLPDTNSASKHGGPAGDTQAYLAAYTDSYQQPTAPQSGHINTLAASLRSQHLVSSLSQSNNPSSHYVNGSASKNKNASATAMPSLPHVTQSGKLAEITPSDHQKSEIIGTSNHLNNGVINNKVRRNADYKISRTSERVITTAKTNKRSNQQQQQQIAMNQTKQQNTLSGKQGNGRAGDRSATQEQIEQQIKADDLIMEFTDTNKNLNGRIGVYKINFNKNLRRFQDIANEQAQKEPRINEIVNRFLQETLLPSVWGFQQLAQSSKFLKQVQNNNNNPVKPCQLSAIASDLMNSPERAENTPTGSSATPGSSTPMYNLNSSVLPLQINFNPLMITYCLFLRALVDMTAAQAQEKAAAGASSQLSGERVAEFCLVHRKKIVSKLYQIQIKAINHALQNLNIEGVAPEQHPAKVIEFIKKWVAKEKVLISHCVKVLIPSNFEKIGDMHQVLQKNANTIKIEESTVYLTKDLAAKKNRQQYASRVNNNNSRSLYKNGCADGSNNLNTSKESEDFIDKKYHPMASMDMGGMTQDNFYKIPQESMSPWKPGDHSMSNPCNLMAVSEWSDQQPVKSLQQKVNNRHRENQHRNLFVEYHQVGSSAAQQKQTIFREPQMALSSSNFNKNHQNSLMQIKIQQQQHLQQPSGLIQKSGSSNHQGRQQIGNTTSEVYGDRKQGQQSTSNNSASHHQHQQNNNTFMHRNSNNGPPTREQLHHPHNQNSPQIQQQHQDTGSYQVHMNRSFSPSHLFAQQQKRQPPYNTRQDESTESGGGDQNGPGGEASVPPALISEDAKHLQSTRTANISGAQTVTSGFFNMHQNKSGPRNFQNKSELGYQNLQNFHWPKVNGQSSEVGGGGAVAGQRPQTRDSYFSPAPGTELNANSQYNVGAAGGGGTGSRRQAQRGQQALAALSNNNSGQVLMRSTAGPASFNLSRGGQCQQIIPSSIHNQAQMAPDRPSTRHGSDERGNMSRPITQGISRRAAGLGQINAIMNGPHPGTTIQKHPDLSRQKIDRQQSLNNQQPIDRTYINQAGPVADVFGRRTSSRGMNRIYGGGNGSASFNQIDVSRGQIQSRQTEKGASKGSSHAGLETLKSLPAGFDPIFNAQSNSNFVNENSHIKIKPMRLSKGFDSGEINQNNNENTFEATETSSFSALSRGTSIGAHEGSAVAAAQQQLKNYDESGGGYHHQQRVEETKKGVIIARKLQQQQRQTSPLYGKNGGGKAQPVADKDERNSKRHTNKGKVIGASQSSHFRKKITSKNNRDTAMESILEEDENQVKEPLKPMQQKGGGLDDNNNIDLKSQLRVKKNTQQHMQRKDAGGGSNGSTTMSTNFTQIKNSDVNGELSTMQTSGGFSNTRRSPRDPSFENSATRGAADSQLRLRPQLLSSQPTTTNNYNSLRPIDKEQTNCQPTK